VLRSAERLVGVDFASGKPACTLFRPLCRYGDFTLVAAQPMTGRTHQIRVHAAHAGVPVAGDEKYGRADANLNLRRLGLKRLFLHASALTFLPDHRQRPLHVQAPMPADLELVLQELEKAP
jgi:23S rRNA pseudouridine955/2504/2580 synthase